MAAFFGSAALTLFAIAYGYFSNSLPERYLTEFDHAIISYVNLEKLEEICFSALFNIKSRTRRALGRKVLSRRPRLSRAQREEVVTRFVLALSDQQLVTGLAILVGTVANQCTLTRYDFNMAFSLAWFSAITHLATLDVLREYLLKHKTVRNWRVFGMVCILGFLIYSLAIMVMRVDDSIPVQCLFDYPRLFGTTGVDYIVLVVLVITIIFLLVNYSRRIQWSIRETNRRLSFSYFLAFGFWKRYGIGKDIASDNVDTFLERLAVHRGFSERRKLLESMKMQDTELGSLHPRLLYSYLYATSLHQGSFIATTTEIMFMISYGITQSISARWTSRGYGSTDHFRKVTVHHDRSMGFGQVTPLLLLILPLFAAAEIYYGESFVVRLKQNY